MRRLYSIRSLTCVLAGLGAVSLVGGERAGGSLGLLRGALVAVAVHADCHGPCEEDSATFSECDHLTMNPTEVCGEDNSCLTSIVYFAKCADGAPTGNQKACETKTDPTALCVTQDVRTMPTLTCQTPVPHYVPGYGEGCNFSRKIRVRCEAPPCIGPIDPNKPADPRYGREVCHNPPGD